MLAAQFIIIRRKQRREKLQRLRLAAYTTNERKRGVGRPEGRIELNTIPEEGWRSQFRYDQQICMLDKVGIDFFWSDLHDPRWNGL
jgi:hypothetical protein